MNSITSIIMLSVVFAETAIAIFVWLKNKKNPINISFAGLAFCIALWTFSLLVMWNTSDMAKLNIWAKNCYTGAILLPVFMLYFVQVFPDRMNIKLSGNVLLAILTAIILLILNYSGMITSGYTSANKYENHFLYYALFTPYLLFFLFVSFRTLIEKLKTCPDIYKNQLKYVCFAIIFSAVIGIFFSLLLPMIHYADFNYLGPLIGGILFLTIIAYAIVKHKLMEISFSITKTGIFVGIYAIVLGIPFMIGYYINWLYATFTMFLLATLGPALYRQLEQKAIDIFLKKENHYRNILLEVSKGISNINDLNKLLKLIIYVVKSAIGLKFAAIFVEDTKSSGFRLEVARNKSSLYFPTYYFSKDHPIISYMNEIQAPFTSDQIPQELLFSLAFTTLKIGLIVPAFIEKKLIGFIVLGEKRDATPFNQDDFHVFEILSRQIALAIINLRFTDDLKKANERVFAAEKLASIGGMTSGIVHQIGNKITQFSMAVHQQKNTISKIQSAQPINEETDKHWKMLGELNNIIDFNVKSLSEMTHGILNFTRARIDKNSNMLCDFSLMDVINLIIPPLKTKHNITEAFPLKIQINGPDIIYGIKTQVMESILNLLDNAYESTEEKYDSILTVEEKLKYSPLIEISLSHTDTNSRIEIHDNGMGISDETAEKLFSPFFTTKTSSKKSGSGIGIYVVKRMIEENMQGKIWFISKKLEGTTFYIELPRKTS